MDLKCITYRAQSVLVGMGLTLQGEYVVFLDRRLTGKNLQTKDRFGHTFCFFYQIPDIVEIPRGHWGTWSTDLQLICNGDMMVYPQVHIRGVFLLFCKGKTFFSSICSVVLWLPWTHPSEYNAKHCWILFPWIWFVHNLLYLIRIDYSKITLYKVIIGTFLTK